MTADVSVSPILLSEWNKVLYRSKKERELTDVMILRSAYHDFTHTILSDLSKGQGALCRRPQIKVSWRLNLISVA